MAAQEPTSAGQESGTVEPDSARSVTRSVDIDAEVLDVWQALTTDEGRERWIEPDPDRVLIVDSEQPPERISWWWWSAEQPATHVILRVVAIPTGTRVFVTETAPASFPVAQLAACFHPVLTFA
jgi:uncharacterized protein YndB with AHSA1/START domain